MEGMKKTTLINAELSYLVASLGHFDEVTICDAGLPIADKVKRIDLALTHGIPAFIDTVKALLSEMQITGVILATEFKQVSPVLHTELLALIAEQEKHVDISYISHEDFKIRTTKSKAVVRTGECTAYANVIFQSGVVF